MWNWLSINRERGRKGLNLFYAQSTVTYIRAREREMQSVASTIINRLTSKLIQCYDT